MINNDLFRGNYQYNAELIKSEIKANTKEKDFFVFLEYS